MRALRLARREPGEQRTRGGVSLAAATLGSCLPLALISAPGSLAAAEGAGGEAGGERGLPRTSPGRGGEMPLPRSPRGETRHYKGEKCAGGRRDWGSGARGQGGTRSKLAPGSRSRQAEPGGRGAELQGGRAGLSLPPMWDRLPGQARPPAPGVLLTPPWQ